MTKTLAEPLTYVNFIITEHLASQRYGSRIGEQFGSLAFLCIAPVRGDSNRLLGDFICNCGNIVTYAIGRVVAGGKSHCGCQTDHGKSRTHGRHGSPEYSSWQAMKWRCLDPNNKDYPRWGGRGISVCDEWATSFEAFYSHIGPRPIGTSLDRIDNRCGYEPGNVRWATHSEQQRNRDTAYVWHIRGLTFQSCDEAASHFKVSGQTVHRWVRGAFDKRRNSFTQPREDCHVTARY